MVRYILSLLEKFRNTNVNNRTIFYNTLGAFLVKGAALIVSLFTMPSYMRYFEDQQILGLWFTILSVLSWVLTFDLGIGNGLRNQLVPVLVKKDTPKIKKYISSAYCIVGLIVLVSLIGSAPFFSFIDWNRIFNISNDIVPKDTLNITVFIVFTGLMLQFLLKLITSILYAMQKSALINFLSLLSNVLILLFVSNAKPNDISTNLVTLALVNLLAVNLPLLLTTFIVFGKELRECKPDVRFFEIVYAKKVLKLGGIFFWVQIMYMIITATNEFLISWLAAPEIVVEYQIYSKLFSLVATVFTLALIPIWSAVTKAFSEKNFIWIRKIYMTLRKMAIVAVIFEFGMILLLQFGIDIWLGENSIKVNYFYAIIFAMLGSIMIWNGVLSSIANGCGELKTQSIVFTIGAIIKVPIAWILVSLLRSWIGIIVANLVVMILYSLVQPIWLNRYLNKID